MPTVELVSCPDLTPTGQSGPARIESLLAFVNSKVQNELGTLKIYVCVQMANWPFFSGCQVADIMNLVPIRYSSQLII